MNILMAAVECRGWAKVGGLADVVRDLSVALATAGHKVTLLLPYFDSITRKTRQLEQLEVRFGGQVHKVTVFGAEELGVELRLLRCEYFSGDYGSVYIDSGSRHHGPFEDDALRFAFFCTAALEFIEFSGRSAWDVLHCHDWHTGLLPLFVHLRRPHFTFKTVFTIHNLDYQGIRPWTGKPGTMEGFSNWFPGLHTELSTSELLENILDRRYPDCFNPMRTALLFSQQVTTVSPTYAKEITLMDNLELGFFGGRGLEDDLGRLADEGRLTGILNGVDYVELDRKTLPFASKEEMLDGWAQSVKASAKRLGPVFVNSEATVTHAPLWAKTVRGRPLVVMVTRAVEQKLGILFHNYLGRSVLDQILDRDIGFAVIGTGDWAPRLDGINTKPNALFLHAYEPGLGDSLYAYGDIFLMPSDFEPCGISQMLAMHYGNLPLVHDRGGLHDTVKTGQNGFAYTGHSRDACASALLHTLDEMLHLYHNDQPRWQELQARARASRFDWTAGLKEYLRVYKA